jgi:hypothetical protein
VGSLAHLDPDRAAEVSATIDAGSDGAEAD